MKATEIPQAQKPQPVSQLIPKATLIYLAILLLGETTINYIDRQVVSVLAPTLRDEFHMSNSQYAAILNAFLITYLFFYSFAGWALDRLGFRRGLSLFFTWWSTAGALTSLSTGPFSLGAFRSLIAVGEAGAWPSFAKAAATWVPAEAQALFIGTCNSGSSLGAMITLPLVAGIVYYTGSWRAAFAITGGVGLLWVVVFQIFMRRHPELVDAKHSVHSGQPKKSWTELLSFRQTWAVFFCRFFADPMWYFFLFWIPEFLTRERGMNLTSIGKVAWIPFLAADISNFVSGFVSMRLQKSGWSVNQTRKGLMIIAACLSPIGILAVYTRSIGWTLALISIAIFFWMFWSVSVHTLAGDYCPATEVASVYGIAGTGSTLGTAISTFAVGYYLDLTHSYTNVFIGIGTLMPIAMIVGLFMMGRVEPVQDKASW